MSATRERFGTDALLNIAGMVSQIAFLNKKNALWDDGIALKVHGACRLMRA